MTAARVYDPDLCEAAQDVLRLASAKYYCKQGQVGTYTAWVMVEFSGHKKNFRRSASYHSHAFGKDAKGALQFVSYKWPNRQEPRPIVLSVLAAVALEDICGATGNGEGVGDAAPNAGTEPAQTAPVESDVDSDSSDNEQEDEDMEEEEEESAMAADSEHDAVELMLVSPSHRDGDADIPKCVAMRRRCRGRPGRSGTSGLSRAQGTATLKDASGAPLAFGENYATRQGHLRTYTSTAGTHAQETATPSPAHVVGNTPVSDATSAQEEDRAAAASAAHGDERVTGTDSQPRSHAYPASALLAPPPIQRRSWPRWKNGSLAVPSDRAGGPS